MRQDHLRGLEGVRGWLVRGLTLTQCIAIPLYNEDSSIISKHFMECRIIAIYTGKANAYPIKSKLSVENVFGCQMVITIWVSGRYEAQRNSVQLHPIVRLD